jgi:hypothetical protein
VPEGQDSDPPGSVSNQNQEEQEAGLGHGHEQPDGEHKDESKERGARHEDDSPGSSTEGSQATGHPDNAG